MAASMRSGVTFLRSLLQTESSVFKQQVRHHYKRIFRGKRPHEARNYAQRVEELEFREQVDIGFPLVARNEKSENKISLTKDTVTKLMKEKKYSEVLEILNEENTCWSEETWDLCEHYGIYTDLFREGFFYPRFSLNVMYDYDEDLALPVCQGNVISPSEALTKPEVTYKGNADKLYTLVMTAPDSHLQDNKKEYLHYLVGNIPGDKVDQGEQLCNYLQPFPVKGTGFHRYVFVLYQQEEKIDYSNEQRPENCTSLADRTFCSFDFYKRLEDKMTPISLAFFQSQWDDSVKDTFWNLLDMQEPIFEFMELLPYHPKQKLWPHKQPFNLYLDRYRDIKDIQEEVLKEKLKDLSPFKPRAPPSRWPSLNFRSELGYPSWLKLKLRHKRRRDMQWVDMN